MKQSWPEAEVLSEPIKSASDPIVLVRRKGPTIIGFGKTNLSGFSINETMTVISLFSGCGGADIGLEKAGFKTVVQHEWAECACKTLLHNRPNWFRNAALIQGDIRKTTTGFILKEAMLGVGEATLLVGGPPCQGFSYANGNRGKGHDERNDLMFEFLRVVNEAKPRFFMFENVRGFIQLNQAAYVKQFLSRAHGCYYELVYGLVNCVEYGVPQDRCRFICMGTRRDMVERNGAIAALPPPTNFGKPDLKRLRKAKPGSTEHNRLTRSPGVRYFPDREFICNPDPSASRSIEGRSENFHRFFDELEKSQPDRIVK